MQCLLWIESGCIVPEKSICRALFLVMEDKEDAVTIVLQVFGQLLYELQKIGDLLKWKLHEWIVRWVFKVRNGTKMEFVCKS